MKCIDIKKANNLKYPKILYSSMIVIVVVILLVVVFIYLFLMLVLIFSIHLYLFHLEKNGRKAN